MGKVEHEVAVLRSLEEIQLCLPAHFGLPGPRANIEQAEAAGRVVDEATSERWSDLDERAAPEKRARGPARLRRASRHRAPAGRGQERRAPAASRRRLGSARRVREAVATALQNLGAADLRRLCDAMDDWVDGKRLEQHAAAAAVCGPRFLRRDEHVRRALATLDRITSRLAAAAHRTGDDVRVLREALGYCRWAAELHPLRE